jgi:hypothetical protein
MTEKVRVHCPNCGTVLATIDESKVLTTLRSRIASLERQLRAESTWHTNALQRAVSAEKRIAELEGHLAFMVDNIGQPNSLETRDGFAAARKAINR